MIRSNVPLPLLFKLRLRATSVARRAIARNTSTLRYRTSTDPKKHATRHTTGNRTLSDVSPVLWAQFIERYEQFTDVLCCAAKNGCTADIETEYTDIRNWFTRNYRSVAQKVRPFLDVEFTGDNETPSTSLIKDYAGSTRTVDALEAIFIPHSISEMLHTDKGDLIPKIARVSDAVYRCHASNQTS